MDTALFSLLAALGLALAVFGGMVAGIHYAKRPDRSWSALTGRRVIVNLKAGTAVDGVLVARQGPLLMIREAVLHGDSDQPVPLDGEVVIERSEVEYLQYPST
ncbi:hypothetical protein AB0K08_13600 [Citricoccus sp. NPDC055426]|uniref:hypothetical protein n=1 Tax=Citricoccus sp. NPDC055426 TaxID=3155536 RepID=UPI00341F1958